VFVPGLDVTVQDPEAVDSLERTGHLHPESQRFVERERSVTADPRVE
jgi:hypothetical protein